MLPFERHLKESGVEGFFHHECHRDCFQKGKKEHDEYLAKKRKYKEFQKATRSATYIEEGARVELPLLTHFSMVLLIYRTGWASTALMSRSQTITP